MLTGSGEFSPYKEVGVHILDHFHTNSIKIANRINQLLSQIIS